MKRDLSVTTSAEIPYMRRVIAVFSRGSGNSGFFQGVAKWLFPEGASRVEISFYYTESKRKTFIYLYVNRKISNFKIQRLPSAPLIWCPCTHDEITSYRYKSLRNFASNNFFDFVFSMSNISSMQRVSSTQQILFYLQYKIQAQTILTVISMKRVQNNSVLLLVTISSRFTSLVVGKAVFKELL